VQACLQEGGVCGIRKIAGTVRDIRKVMPLDQMPYEFLRRCRGYADPRRDLIKWCLLVK
jgi:hypothetical protein